MDDAIYENSSFAIVTAEGLEPSANRAKWTAETRDYHVSNYPFPNRACTFQCTRLSRYLAPL